MFFKIASMPRSVGDWTRDKLKILEDYLPAYLLATSSAVDRIYVDAFAGPGTNLLRRSGLEIDGSPLIAIKARAVNGSQFTRLYFIEQDRLAAEELRAHIREVDEGNRCVVLEGNVNERLPEVIQALHPRAPTFVFLDTDGIDPAMSTLASIADWRVEFLINFPLGMSINRNPDSAKTLAYFGTEEAIEILYSEGTGRTRQLLDLYKRKLEELGWVHTTTDDRLVKTENNQRLYYLVFVSKSDVGQRIMGAVFKRPDAAGQGRLQL